MNCSSTETLKFGQRKTLHTIIFVIAMISFMLNNSNARAATVIPYNYQLAAAADKIDDMWQFTMAFDKRPPRRLRGKRL